MQEEKKQALDQMTTQIVNELTPDQCTALDIVNALKFENPTQCVYFLTALCANIQKSYEGIDVNLDDNAPGMLLASSTPIGDNKTAFYVHAFGPPHRIGGIHVKLGKQSEMKKCIGAYISKQIADRLNVMLNDDMTPSEIEDKLEEIFSKTPAEIFGEDKMKVEVSTQENVVGLAEDVEEQRQRDAEAFGRVMTEQLMNAEQFAESVAETAKAQAIDEALNVPDPNADTEKKS